MACNEVLKAIEIDGEALSRPPNSVPPSCGGIALYPRADLLGLGAVALGPLGGHPLTEAEAPAWSAAETRPPIGDG